MEELQKLVNELEAEQSELEQRSSELYRKLENAREKLALEKQKDIEDFLPYYTQKLERMKDYIEGYMAESRGNEVHYVFRKQDYPYTGDFHEIIQDPLDYMMGEYDCLGMNKFLEIVFEYHNESVRHFVKSWMDENIDYATPYSNLSQLYNPNFSKK
jgi:hypothetical protein